MTPAERRDGPLVFHLVPHTHWDREWYLGAAAFRARLVPLMDDLLDRLLYDSAYRTFLLDGQTVLPADYLTVRPEQENLVRRLAGERRLQLGPWYVLADEQIPSGESLVRNLLLGARDAARWGGREGGGMLHALYSPDMFGHPAALPMIAQEFGLSCGAAWRGLHPARARGRDFVRWAGPDGRELLLYHLPRDGYEVGSALPAEMDALLPAWMSLREQLVERAATPHIAVLVGADHHTPHPQLPRLRDLLAELEPEHDVRISRLDEFLSAAAASAGPVSLPVVRGELRSSYGYTWTLQGVHGTRTPQKRRNSDLELLLERAAEPLAALAAAAGGRDERPLLTHTWRTLVECHFHDSIAGCSSDEVAAAVDARFDSVAGAAGEIVRRALHRLSGHDPDRARAAPAATEAVLVMWNPAARPRGGIVVADLTSFRSHVRVGPPPARGVEGEAGPPHSEEGSPNPQDGGRGGGGAEPLSLRTAEGRLISLQVLERGSALERLDAPGHYPDLDSVARVRVAFEVPEMRGLALTLLTPDSTRPPTRRRELHRRGRTLANRFVEVTAETDGTLTMVDRITGERYERLLQWEGEDDAGDTYTPCPPPDGALSHRAGEARIRDVADGPLIAALEIRTALVTGRAAAGDGAGWADIRAVVMLFADDPVVRVRVELVNAARDHRLRLRFPAGLPGRAAIAGTAFGVVRREAVEPAAFDGSMETPVRTAPAHRFVAAADGMRGLALFAPGFFEYEWTRDGALLFTALRSTGMLSRADLPTRPGHAGWTTETPAAQCLGEQRFDIALTPAGGAVLDRPDELIALWEDAFLPLRPLWLRMAALDPAARDAMASAELEGAGLVLSAVKPAEQGSGIVLRCYNVLERPATGLWRMNWALQQAWRVRADECEPEELALAGDRRTVRFTAPAHGIVTIVVR